MFRIIGIKILKDCAPSIRKVLKEGELYILSDSFVASESEEVLRYIQKTDDDTVSSLYDVTMKNGHRVHVEVSAIVGKNGDGKSSIAEVVIRVLNNFAIATGYRENQDSLTIVKGLNAILYYEVDKVIYSIKCLSENVSWYRNGEEITDLINISDLKDRKIHLKKNHADKLFYMLFVDYSLYGLNSQRLSKESDGDGSWIDGLFYKNDSYQTPVVIAPMREYGNIDVNKEEFLSRQRLLSIFCSTDYDAKPEEKIESRKISDTEVALGYAFRIEKESKFIRKTVRQYIVDTRNESHERPELQEYNTYKNIITPYYIEVICNFVESVGRHLSDYPALLKVAKEANSGWTQKGSTDIFRYIKLVQDQIAKNQQIRNKYKDRLYFLKVIKSSPRLNYVQLYRLMLIVTVWEILVSDNKFNMQSSDLNSAIEHRDEPRNAAKLYILYKIVAIIEHYRGLTQQWYRSDEKMNCLFCGWIETSTINQIRKDIDNIYSTHDYRTLKLWQTICYLGNEEEFYGAGACNLVGLKNFSKYVDFDTLQEKLGGDNDMEHLPCPIFEGDIVLNNGVDNYPLNTLSSGMTQRLNSVGSFIYHLRNLDDNQTDDSLIAYDNILTVFEEVELYFHPEFQKSYLRYLLAQLERTNLNRITNLHLIFVTHSPFVLSDVLTRNMLCMKDGLAVKESFVTFGANIHNILRQPFFMENGTIGDYAQHIINRIVISLKIHEFLKNEQNNWSDFIAEIDQMRYGYLIPTKDKVLDKDWFCRLNPKDTLSQLIDLIDEPLARHALRGEYMRIFSDRETIDKRIEELSKELEKLINQRDDVAHRKD